MKPTTPLPWKQADGHFQHVTGGDLAYIIHAANAYPKLIAAMRSIAKPALGGKQQQYAAQAILKELGE